MMDKAETMTMERRLGKGGHGSGGSDGGSRPGGNGGDAGEPRSPGVPGPPSPRGGGGAFRQYKPEQGKGTRYGTLCGAGALITWGAIFLYDQLQVFEGDEAWRLLVTTGIPILFAVVFGAAAWWVAQVSRKTSDFMIATEGEMKKVNWSTKREVIGSTKVVIIFTLLLAMFIFLVDIVFQELFSSLGVLRR